MEDPGTTGQPLLPELFGVGVLFGRHIDVVLMHPAVPYKT